MTLPGTGARVWSGTTPRRRELPMRAWLPERQVSGPERAVERDIESLNRVFADAFTDRYRRDGLVGVRVPHLNPQVWRYALLDAGDGAMVWRDEAGQGVPFHGADRPGAPVAAPRGRAAGRDRGGRPARRGARPWPGLHAGDPAHRAARSRRHDAGGRQRRARRLRAVALGAARRGPAQGRAPHPEARRARRARIRSRARRHRGGGGAHRHPPRRDPLSDPLRDGVPAPDRAWLPRALDRPAHDLRGVPRAPRGHGRAVLQLGDLTGLIIFAATYFLIAVQRLPFVHLNRPAASLLGAVAMVAFRVLPLPDAYAAIDFDVLVFLLGLMLIVGYLEVGKFFEWAAEWVLKRAVTPERLLLGVVIGGGLLSALFVNDTICLVVTPVLLAALGPLRVRPNPYLIGLAMGSNVGSVLSIP